MAATNLGSSSKHVGLDAAAWLANHFFAQDSLTGAGPTLFAATEPIPGGSYAGPANRWEMAGPPQLVDPDKRALDPVSAKRLWATSEILTGVSYPL